MTLMVKVIIFVQLILLILVILVILEENEGPIRVFRHFIDEIDR